MSIAHRNTHSSLHDALICSLLRGEAVGWQGVGVDGEITDFLARADYHGVAPLVDVCLRNPLLTNGWPDAIRSRCRQRAIFEAVRNLAQHGEIARLLKGFHEAQLRPLILKGTALAYNLYPSPALRPRSDIDLLVPACDKRRSEEVMRSMGYVLDGVPMGKHISHQSSWSHVDRLGTTHDVDLHWRANNSPVLAKLLDYRDMESRAVTVQALGPDAYTLCPVHALLFACIHRAGHLNAPYYANGVAHPAKDRLIWLYDIHLLASQLTSTELDEVAVLAVQKRMTAICREALALCIELLQLQLPEPVMAKLSPEGPEEPSSRFFRGGPARQMIGDFFALDDVAARSGWLMELVFPSSQYVRAKYQGATLSWLPMLYLRRALGGIWKTLGSRHY